MNKIVARVVGNFHDYFGESYAGIFVYYPRSYRGFYQVMYHPKHPAQWMRTGDSIPPEWEPIRMTVEEVIAIAEPPVPPAFMQWDLREDKDVTNAVFNVAHHLMTNGHVQFAIDVVKMLDGHLVTLTEDRVRILKANGNDGATLSSWIKEYAKAIISSTDDLV